MPKELVRRIWHLWITKRIYPAISSPEKHQTKLLYSSVTETKVKIGLQRNTVSWVVVQCRYDLLLRMPRKCGPKSETYYHARSVRAHKQDLSLKSGTIADILVSNLGVKKLSRFWGKTHMTTKQMVIQWRNVNSKPKAKARSSNMNNLHLEIKLVLEKLNILIQDKLPRGLPPICCIDH